MTRSERTSKKRLRSVARGLDTAAKAIHATADNDDPRALAILNAQDYQTSLHTNAYLLGCLRQMALIMAKGDPQETARLLHAGADGAANDGPISQAEVIIAESFNRLTGA